MLSAQARRADADDAVVRAEMARTELEQARGRLSVHRLDAERRLAVRRARRAGVAPRRRD